MLNTPQSVEDLAAVPAVLSPLDALDAEPG